MMGVVLAAGSSSRFGSDKARAVLGTKTLLEHVCARAAPQVDRLVINPKEGQLSQFVGEYESLPDEWPGEGPLAGILTALEYARSESFAQLVSFPCDTPLFPADLVSRLRNQLSLNSADCCVAKCGDTEQRALALWDVACAPLLKSWFFTGLRSLRDVPNVLTVTVAEFLPKEVGVSDGGFFNINTPDDLIAAARRFALV
jgi:molybdopterin-guanine dinucleotide biosynthesis protein A